MVETRSGRSVGEGEDTPGLMTAKNRDTAGSAATRGGRRVARKGAAPGFSGLNDSQAYTLLALGLLINAMPCIFTPKLTARLAFGSAAQPPDDQHSWTLNLLSCGLMGAACVAFALEECARKNMLHTFTADTLKLALVGFAAGNLLLQFYYPATLDPLANIFAMVAHAAILALPASQLVVAREDRERVSRDFSRLPTSLVRGPWLRKPTLTGALYLLLTAAFPAAGLAYFVAPKWTLYHVFGYVYGKSTFLVWKAVGAGLMTILPAMTFTLKDKAENDLLARSVPRTLNLGLMGAAVGHLLVFGPLLTQMRGGFLLPLLTATWGLALITSMAGLAAPQAAAFVEEVEEVARREE